VRGLLASVMPFPAKFGVLLRLAKLGKMFSPVMPKLLRGMLSLAPSTPLAKPLPAGRTIWPAEGQRKKRVILMQGCVQQVLAGQINDATIRVLTRLGCDVVVADGSGCCGALTHHMGKGHQALVAVKANVRAWTTEIDGEGVDAIVVNASGCGTTVKDYGFMLRNDEELADAAERISGLTQDISEFLVELGNLPFTSETTMKVTYHSACSLQHGQKVTAAPISLLKSAGFSVSEPLEPHLCCGSAGTYNMMQPEIAGQLRDRKAANIARTAPEVVATGNIGCLMQLREVVDAPVVHTVELLDWATGGPPPNGLPQTASEK